MSDVAYKGARGADYGSSPEQREWMSKGTQKRQKGELMRQFQKLESGTGNSPEYRTNYEKIDWSNG